MPAYKDDDGRWRYRFAFRGKRYSGSTARGHNTKAAADTLERQHIEKLETRSFTGTMPTVEQFAPQFLDYQKSNAKPLTYKNNETIVRVNILPHIGKLPIDEVDKQAMAKLVMTWRETAAIRTCNSRLGILQRMLALAVEWEILPAVPKVKQLKTPSDLPRFLTDAEQLLLLEAAGWQWRVMALVALRTGLRIGELRGLQWGDVDFDKGAISVRRTDPGIAGEEPTSPKGGRSRVVPITDEALTALERWRHMSDNTKPGDWVWPSEWDAARTRSEGNCASAMGRIAERAKLQDVTWHTLRHTYASQLVMRGVPMRAIQDLLGHATIKMTEKYAHLAPGFANRTMVAVLDYPIAPSSLPLLPEPESQPGAKDDPEPPATPRKRSYRE